MGSVAKAFIIILILIILLKHPQLVSEIINGFNNLVNG